MPGMQSRVVTKSSHAASAAHGELMGESFVTFTWPARRIGERRLAAAAVAPPPCEAWDDMIDEVRASTMRLRDMIADAQQLGMRLTQPTFPTTGRRSR
jgi:hypothetical protein